MSRRPYVCVLFRLVLPLALTAASSVRFSVFSLVYILLLLLLPLLPQPTPNTSSPSRCVTAVCVSSLLFLLLQAFFQVTTITLQPDYNCTSWQKALSQLGLISLSGSDAGSVIRHIAPDLAVLVAALVTWRLSSTLSAPPHQLQQQDGSLMPEPMDTGAEEPERTSRLCVELQSLLQHLKHLQGNMTSTGGQLLLTALLGLTGIVFPSLSSMPYLLCFQVLCSWWAWSGRVSSLMIGHVSVASLLYSACHFLLFYCCQLPTLQDTMVNSSTASVFGVVPLVRVDCSAPWRLQLSPELRWFHVCSPLMVLLLFHCVCALRRNKLLTGDVSSDVEGEEPVEGEELRDGEEPLEGEESLDETDDSVFELSAEVKRALWSRTHIQVSSANHSSSGSYCPPTQSTALATTQYSTPQFSVSQSDTLETCMFEDDLDQSLDQSLDQGEELFDRRGVASVALAFLLRQSYIAALVAMLAWAISYVSWLSCVLLVWSCVLWMMRERRRHTLDSAPWLVAYGNLLLILQYIFSLPEVDKVPGVFPQKEEPCLELASKLICLLSFWMLLRQSITEKQSALVKESPSPTRLSSVTVHSTDGSCEDVFPLQTDAGQMNVLGAVLKRMFVKYWIYVCGTMFFFVSFEGKIVLYKVIYMVMFLCCVALYQVNYQWWRSLLRGFWLTVVVYSMMVLILVYTFQFPSAPLSWSYYSGLSIHRLGDLGLEKFSVPVLFTRIFIPAAFLLVCVIHLHYFHEPFLQLTDLQTVVDTHNSTITRLVHSEGSLVDLSEDRGLYNCTESKVPQKSLESPEPEEELHSLSDRIAVLVSWRLVVDRLSVLFLRFLLSLQKLQRLLWWLLELHIVKVVSAYIIWVSVKEVCVFNLLFVLCVAVSLPCRRWRPLLSSVCTVWTSVVIICKMLYQLSAVQPGHYSSNCSMPVNSSLDLSKSALYSGPVDPAQWVGLRKTKGRVLDYLLSNLTMLALLAFEVTVYRHQELYRLRHGESPPPTRTLFDDITRRHLDDGLLSCTKYFLNYFFYKFGLETCFLLAVNVIGQRMDVFAVGHALALISIMWQRSRSVISVLWPRYCSFLSAMLCVQYVLCIGYPPASCTDYPWRAPLTGLDSNVVKWLFLPDHLTPPNPMFLLYDFLLLLGASLQGQVFEDELQPHVQHVAGDNTELDPEQDPDLIRRLRSNPVPDFMMCRSYLDTLKVIIFCYMFWFVLTVIFITGTTRISVFCMGYLVACFYFLLVGGDLLLKPLSSILLYWDCLIGYNVFVITMKNVLSILACGLIKSLVVNHCWLIQLFSLACTIKGYSKPEQTSKHCELPNDEAGIIWDGICFCFLLLQRRVFRSHYFLYVLLDLHNTQLLASRGAELFEASTVKAVRARLQVEKNSMDLLKRQMERIKSRQQKFRRGKESLMSFNKEATEAEAKAGQKERKKNGKWWKPWVNHASMIRSGDYYLFETDSDEETEEEREEEQKQTAPPPDKSAFQFVYHAWITDSRTAMRARHRQNKHQQRSAHRKPHRAAAIEVSTETDEEDTGEELDNIAETVLQRLSSGLRFCWVLVSALLDSLTTWLRGLCLEHIHISTVLRIERCMLTQQARQGLAPSREGIHLYYQQQLKRSSKESGLDHRDTDTDWTQTGPDRTEARQKKVPLIKTRPKQFSLNYSTVNRTKAATLTQAMLTQDALSQATMTQDTLSQATLTQATLTRATLTQATLIQAKLTQATLIQALLTQATLTQATLTQAMLTLATLMADHTEPSNNEDTPHLCGLEEGGPTEWIKDHHEMSVQLSSVKSSGQQHRPRLLKMRRVRSSSSSEAEDELSHSCSHLPPSYSLALGLDRAPELLQRIEGPLESPLSLSRTQELTASELLQNRTFYNEELEASDSFFSQQPQLLQLCYTLYNILAARSEAVCFLVMVVNHMVSASCLTLVLPVLVFLWASLSVPRTSKSFWMTAIIYTEVTIVIKYFFQFGFFPFNQKLEVDRSKPFHPPNILGVEKKEGYVIYDLLQLLALFYHRAILKVHGLWDQNDPEAELPNSQLSSNHASCSEPPAGTPTADRREQPASSPQSSADSTGSRVQPERKIHMFLSKLRDMSLKAQRHSVSRVRVACSPAQDFLRALVQPEYSAVTDVYVLMFLADTVDFIIIVFGFWAFGKHSAAADITSSLSEDQVPEAFLVMVLIQFATMVIDRALYLRKTVLGKLVFQVILVLGIHFWMFFILPTVTERRFNQNLVAQLWYFVKCVYFGLSAYQIRSGYPTRVLGNFLTKSHNYLNLFLFQGFRMVPFLTELRAVMDWVWTDTTLSLSSWICVEDIYAHCFTLKCWRESEKRYPQPRGQKKKRVVKYGMGGLIVLLLICIVWFPLLFMSLVKSVAGVVNRPLDVSVTVTLGGFQPVFTMSAQQNQLRDLSEREYQVFLNSYSYEPNALQFLEAYGAEDVTVAALPGSSNSLWTISPPSRSYLSHVLHLDNFPLTLSWTIQRNLSRGAKAELASGKHVTYLDDHTRLELIQLLNGTRTQPVVIPDVFPCFIRAPSDSNAKPIEQLYPDEHFKDILLALERTTSSRSDMQEWWIVDQSANSVVHLGGVATERQEAGLQLFVFSDKVSPPSLGFLAGYGIMGLYASVVLVIGKFVREFFSGISHSIMFEELPCVDRILKLCTDIFLVRETGELELEEELYAKLIFLYRSPETLIKWTQR
uniref:Piezo-type mechanosensitive ion channel component n=1 Tax=Knipowitschia caucasica TaxID=637954 RepID=A0AAV2LED3_KNICA